MPTHTATLQAVTTRLGRIAGVDQRRHWSTDRISEGQCSRLTHDLDLDLDKYTKKGNTLGGGVTVTDCHARRHPGSPHITILHQSLIQGGTDPSWLPPPLYRTLTFDLQSPASYEHDLLTCKIQGQRSVGSEDRVETNGRTDGRRWLHYLPHQCSR